MKAIQQQDTDKIIFLDNISVITLDKDRCRVVFNFMNSIFIFGRWTPDYHYFQYRTEEKAVEAFNKIKSLPHFRINYFISDIESNLDIINKESITSVSIKDNENRIIFNLNFSITSYKDKQPIEISKFIFWNYTNEDEVYNDRLQVYENLGEIVTI